MVPFGGPLYSFGQFNPDNLIAAKSQKTKNDIASKYYLNQLERMQSWQKALLDENGKVPIGRPIFNSVAYVLDEQMQPVPLDKIGQLYVCSANLCDGYVGTKHKNFMPNKVIHSYFYFLG